MGQVYEHVICTTLHIATSNTNKIPQRMAVWDCSEIYKAWGLNNIVNKWDYVFRFFNLALLLLLDLLVSVAGSFIFASKLLRSDPETKVYERLLSNCLRYILPLFVQINFHSSFFLILFTARITFFGRVLGTLQCTLFSPLQPDRVLWSYWRLRLFDRLRIFTYYRIRSLSRVWWTWR